MALINNPPPRIDTASAKGMDEIMTNLYLGDILSSYNVEGLRAKNITTVLSLIDQPLPDWLRDQYTSLNIIHKEFKVDDNEQEDILKIIPDACDTIDSVLQNGSAILVHCALGVSRSGSAVIAYLMKSQSKSRSEALELVKMKRPRVQPNSGFWEQLGIWEECQYELLNSDGKEKEPVSAWKKKVEGKVEQKSTETSRLEQDLRGIRKDMEYEET